MSTTLLLAVGCIVFAITTLASLWAGYLLLQRAWVNQNPELASAGDKIRPLFASDTPEHPTVAEEA
ncbi:MAG: hypothetical protein OEV40_13850 [Acidimicrobiia bacterium]|nr:hypothetical protein [Acidimicrobiia bacterium]